MNKFYVVGSINIDMVTHVPHFPVPGETIIGGDTSILTGGKGGNQAVALARLGNHVSMMGMMGKDEWGDIYAHTFHKEGIHTDYVERSSAASTGMAFIEVDPLGQNRIVVIPGTNNLVDTHYIDRVSSFIIEQAKQGGQHIVLVQLETPLESVHHLLHTLSPQEHIVSIFDPAPAQVLPQEIFAHIDYIIPNETEASILTGVDIQSEKDIIRAGHILLDQQCNNVIIKVGANGAYHITKTNVTHIPPQRPVKAIDTTAAGDSFNAGFAHCIAQQKPIAEAIAYANIVAGLSTTKHGAQPAMPSLQEVASYHRT